MVAVPHVPGLGDGARPGRAYTEKVLILSGVTRTIKRITSSGSGGGSSPRYLRDRAVGSDLPVSSAIPAVPRISTEWYGLDQQLTTVSACDSTLPAHNLHPVCIRGGSPPRKGDLSLNESLSRALTTGQ